MKIDKNTFNRNLRTHGIHEVVFQEGDVGNCMYVIFDGKVEIRKRVSDETTRTMITLQAGDFFGEMALIDKNVRSASAIAVTDCRLLRVDEQTFYILIQKNPDFALKMIKTLSSRLRKTDALLEEMLSLNVQKRILAGMGTYLASRSKLVDNGQSDLKNKKSVVFSRSQFCIWTTKHLGIAEKMASMVIESLINANLIQKMDSSSNDLIRIGGKVLASIIPKK